MLPINRIDNCERILTTGQYQTTNARNLEDLWLLKYLKSNRKLSDDEIYDIWIKIYPNKFPRCIDDPNPNRTFNILMRSAQRSSIKEKYKDIVIYQDELDWINRTPAFRWVKEYMLLFLAWVRMTGNTKIDNCPFRDVLKMTSIARYSQKNKEFLVSELIKYGMLEGTEVDIYYEELPIISDNGYLIGYERGVTQREIRNIATFDRVETHGECIIQVKQLYDIPKYFNMISMTKTCVKCGKEFEYNSDTKREICEDCWKEQRQEANTAAKKSVYVKIHETRVCTECGSFFEADGNTQRNICAECWGKRENLRLRKVMAESYNRINEIRICTECGKEFEANGKTKRFICHDCWKQDLKQRKYNWYLNHKKQ